MFAHVVQIVDGPEVLAFAGHSGRTRLPHRPDPSDNILFGLAIPEGELGELNM